MARILLKDAVEMIAPRIGKDPKSDRADILFLLDRAQEMAYNKGTWWGMYKEMHIRTSNSDVFLPYPYDRLVSVNVNGRPRLKRGVHYQFHQNGYGSIEDCYNKSRGQWREDVVDKGEYPVPWQPHGAHLHVRARTQEQDGSSVTIAGENTDGPVFTYYYDEEEAKSAGLVGKPLGECQVCTTVDESDRINYTKTSFGEVVPIQSGAVVETTSYFSVIDSITKTPTLGPIDIYAVMGDFAERLVTLQPEQTESIFRRYLLPDSCENLECVHVLAKVSEPSPLHHDMQPLMIQSRIGLLYLTMSAHHEFNKMDPGLAQSYLEKGLLALDEQNTEKTGHNVQPIQVSTPETDVDRSYRFR